MTQAQRDQINSNVACLPQDQRKIYDDARGSPSADGGTGKWAKAGTLCTGTARAGNRATAQTIYDSSGAVIGVVLFPGWFTSSATNQKFALMQEANRIKDGPLYPMPHGGKVADGTATANERLEWEMWVLINNILVAIRDARSRGSFATITRPAGTSEADWKKEICANLKWAKDQIALADARKVKAKAKIAEAKAAGVNTAEAEAKLKDEVCKQLEDERTRINNLWTSTGC